MKSSEQRCIVAYLDGLPPSLHYGDPRQAKVNALRERDPHRPCPQRGRDTSPCRGGRRGLSALMPSILDKAFKDEL